ncbi:Membrane associated serine protease, rhomboid family [Chitinophaga rupis]|uniref:Membrane associated serine protease, rhomboid family n=1 Tax=Chitinophaga rupis TaxID=573321 RepID=A0A1H7T720_9BACT|nr:rhomboid family intramembrane serine protease [Chitinophaga rupis]SEL80309.1 Membrane associated serine protease, rhomboid family [Chitinophaga rupis]
MLTLSLVIIIVTCIISITAFSRPGEMDKLSMWPYMVKEHNQYYRFITAGLVHADYMHLGFNMLTMWFFGKYIEIMFQQIFGGKLYFLLFYVLALIISDIPSYIRHRNNYSYRSIGASGAVSAVVFAFILFQPWAKIIVFVIPMPAILYGVLFLGYSVYMSRRGGDGINHDAHFWGAVFGVVFPLALKPQLAGYFMEQISSLWR